MKVSGPAKRAFFLSGHQPELAWPKYLQKGPLLRSKVVFGRSKPTRLTTRGPKDAIIRLHFGSALTVILLINLGRSKVTRFECQYVSIKFYGSRTGLVPRFSSLQVVEILFAQMPSSGLRKWPTAMLNLKASDFHNNALCGLPVIDCSDLGR